MRSLAIALIVWSAVALGAVFFNPGFGELALCMRLIGRTAECEATQQAYNDVAMWTYQVPVAVALIAGYVAIAIVAARGARRRR